MGEFKESIIGKMNYAADLMIWHNLKYKKANSYLELLRNREDTGLWFPLPYDQIEHNTLELLYLKEVAATSLCDSDIYLVRFNRFIAMVDYNMGFFSKTPINEDFKPFENVMDAYNSITDTVIDTASIQFENEIIEIPVQYIVCSLMHYSDLCVYLACKEGQHITVGRRKGSGVYCSRGSIKWIVTPPTI